MHVHLNGLVSTDLVRDLLIDSNSKIPSGFCLKNDLNITSPAKSLSEYLKPWSVLRLIPQSRRELGLIIESAFANLQKENVKFVELRNTIKYVATLNGISLKDALHWVITDIEYYADKYNIQAGLIITVSRGESSSIVLSELLKAYVDLGCPKMVVGLDLAGDEDIPIPIDTASIFMNAKDKYELGITIHAGETGNFNNIKDAILQFGADRIGHGTALIKSDEVIELVKSRNICIEVCPISNRLTNAVNSNEVHPVVHMIGCDIPFVLCSDNPSIHRSSISQDYSEFYNETKNNEILNNMFSIQKKYSFIKGLK
ncbi:adenosine deaminase [Providencia rettgeri]|nr:adenosine deaminase [Providencia rettgeri]MCG5378745.1 adenosine deaminase [Providencia rettgeri]